MIFQDFSLDKINELPKVNWNDLKLLWHVAYWDGPRSGLLSYKGIKYWFQVFDEPDDASIFRRFLIIQLSVEQLLEEEQWHDLFRQKVGTHTDYDEDGKKHIGTPQPENTWHEFYDAYKSRLIQDFSNNLVVGWFEY